MHEVVVYDARKTKQGSVYDVQPACTLGRQSKQARKQASKASKQSKQASTQGQEQAVTAWMGKDFITEV